MTENINLKDVRLVGFAPFDLYHEFDEVLRLYKGGENSIVEWANIPCTIDKTIAQLQQQELGPISCILIRGLAGGASEFGDGKWIHEYIKKSGLSIPGVHIGGSICSCHTSVPFPENSMVLYPQERRIANMQLARTLMNFALQQ